MASIDDELDSLVSEINSLGSPSKSTPATTKATTSTAKQKANPFDEPERVPTVDDFDSFLSDFEAAPAAQRAVSVKKPQIKRKGKYTVTGAMQDQELTTMLEDLDSKAATVDLRVGAKGTCAFCNQPILNDILHVQKKDYHPEHVFCSNCRKRQLDNKYFEKDGLILCPSCHGVQTGMICAGCGIPILDKCVNAMGKHWHPEHFKCAKCGNGFPSGRFNELNDRPFCKNCFRDISMVCKACNKPITSNGLSALGTMFHKECWGCPVCKKPFGPGFYQYEGLPYCERHYLEKMGIPMCPGCNAPISGQFLSAMGKKWHPDHFVCSLCTNPLQPDYQVQAGKPYCPSCFSSL